MSGSLSEASLELPPPSHSPAQDQARVPASPRSALEPGHRASASHSLVPPPSRPHQFRCAS